MGNQPLRVPIAYLTLRDCNEPRYFTLIVKVCHATGLLETSTRVAWSVWSAWLAAMPRTQRASLRAALRNDPIRSSPLRHPHTALPSPIVYLFSPQQKQIAAPYVYKTRQLNSQRKRPARNRQPHQRKRVGLRKWSGLRGQFRAPSQLHVRVDQCLRR